MSILFRKRRVGLQRLEDRALPATMTVVDTSAADNVTVTTLADTIDPHDGLISLREAIAVANADSAPSVITFASGLIGTARLTLAADQGGGELLLTSPVVIAGPGAFQITVQQTLTGQRVFHATGGGAVTLSGMTIAGGSAATGGGAGVLNEGANLTLDAVEVVGNDAGAFDGGGVHSSGGTLTVRGSTFTNNRTTGNGGAVKVSGGSATFVNSTFDSNTAGNGGGLDLAGTGVVATIANSTITANTGIGLPPPQGDGPMILIAPLIGGGVNIGSDSVTIQSSIIALNDPIDVAGTLAAGSGNNFIVNNLPPGSLAPIQAPPELGPLQLNGGTTRTRLPSADPRIIDQGVNPLNAANDQIGNPRVSGSAADIGSVEIQQPTLPGPSDQARQQNMALIQAVTAALAALGPNSPVQLLALTDMTGDGLLDLTLSVRLGAGRSSVQVIVGLNGVTGQPLFVMPSPLARA